MSSPLLFYSFYHSNTSLANLQGFCLESDPINFPEKSMLPFQETLIFDYSLKAGFYTIDDLAFT